MRNNPVAKVCLTRSFRLALQTIFLIVTLLVNKPLIDSRAQSSGLQSNDLYQLRSAGDAQFSPDGTRIAYSVANNDRPGSPYSQLWLMEIASGS